MESRVVVVTGAFGALGHVVVEAAAARGALTAALDFSAAPSADSRGAFRPGTLIVGGVNLAVADEAVAAMAAVKTRFGRLDA